jgi:predicted DNA-binding transcriptional regulator
MDENSAPVAVAALFGRLVEESLPGQRGVTAWRALLHAHATLMRQLDTDLREDTGLSLADFDVLAQLAAAGGELRMTDLAARALISRSGLTRRVAGLVDQGLLRRANAKSQWLSRPRLGYAPDRSRLCWAPTPRRPPNLPRLMRSLAIRVGGSAHDPAARS